MQKNKLSPKNRRILVVLVSISLLILVVLWVIFKTTILVPRNVLRDFEKISPNSSAVLSVCRHNKVTVHKIEEQLGSSPLSVRQRFYGWPEGRLIVDSQNIADVVIEGESVAIWQKQKLSHFELYYRCYVLRKN